MLCVMKCNRHWSVQQQTRQRWALPSETSQPHHLMSKLFMVTFFFLLDNSLQFFLYLYSVVSVLTDRIW